MELVASRIDESVRALLRSGRGTRKVFRLADPPASLAGPLTIVKATTPHAQTSTLFVYEMARSDSISGGRYLRKGRGYEGAPRADQAVSRSEASFAHATVPHTSVSRLVVRLLKPKSVSTS